jgi:hypothetical protein
MYAYEVCISRVLRLMKTRVRLTSTRSTLENWWLWSPSMSESIVALIKAG